LDINNVPIKFLIIFFYFFFSNLFSEFSILLIIIKYFILILHQYYFLRSLRVAQHLFTFLFTWTRVEDAEDALLYQKE